MTINPTIHKDSIVAVADDTGDVLFANAYNVYSDTKFGQLTCPLSRSQVESNFWLT